MWVSKRVWSLLISNDKEYKLELGNVYLFTFQFNRTRRLCKTCFFSSRTFCNSRCFNGILVSDFTGEITVSPNTSLENLSYSRTTLFQLHFYFVGATSKKKKQGVRQQNIQIFGYTESLWPMSWMRFAACWRYESSLSLSIPCLRLGVFKICSFVNIHLDAGHDTAIPQHRDKFGLTAQAQYKHYAKEKCLAYIVIGCNMETFSVITQ